MTRLGRVTAPRMSSILCAACGGGGGSSSGYSVTYSAYGATGGAVPRGASIRID